MKKILLTTCLLLTLSLPTAVLAQSSRPTPNASIAAMQEARLGNRENNLKSRADTEITRRISSLNNLITRINQFKKLSADQKTSLTAQVQAQITSLNTLKTKIDADSDIDTLKTDVKSIVDSYRIYLLFIPKIHILAAADVELQAVDTFTDLYTKLQTRIQAAGNPANLTSALSDMQSKTADAKTQATNAQETVLPLTPDDYPNNKTQLEAARTMLQTGRHDLDQARLDARTIVQALKQVVNSATPSSALQKQ